mmetsp:Transcript_80190/g.223311  ORF Transcript_80190/g.223311 Transcript_80190/m.223311 type:complete len:341 (-) Transcript_80190:120-1142(-)
MIPRFLELFVRHHERLGNEPPAEDAAAEIPLVGMVLALREQLGALRHLGVFARDNSRLERPAGEVAHATADGRNAASRDLLNNLRADDATVRKFSKLEHIGARGDAETDDNRQILPFGTQLHRGVPEGLNNAPALSDARLLYCRLLHVAHPCSPQQGDDVDHARDRVQSGLSRLFDPFRPAGRRGKGNETESIGRRGRRHDAPRFLTWQIHYNESVHAGFLGCLASLLHTGGQERIVVAHHQHRNGQPLGAGLLAVLEHVRILHAVFQRHDARGLDNRAIGHWVGERHAELDDVGTVLLHLEQRWHSVLQVRVSRRDKSHEGGALGLATCREAVGEALRH